MPKICYIDRRFRSATLRIVEDANRIIADYLADGLALTLRQLYYQFVSRDPMKNTQRDYDRLGRIINDARLAGLIDWEAIEDRGRNLLSWSHFDSPGDAIADAASKYRIDRWRDQPTYVEVWVEKQALEGVIQLACREHHVPHLACKGYMSQSEMWRAATDRFERIRDEGRNVVLIHLGDHDPSGLDMTRDINDRLDLFMGGVDVRRIALNMPQVEEFQCPPNPAKQTDSRCQEYILEHGHSSWELDALEPRTLVSRIREEIESVLDEEQWNKSTERWEEGKRRLAGVAEDFGAEP